MRLHSGSYRRLTVVVVFSLAILALSVQKSAAGVESAVTCDQCFTAYDKCIGVCHNSSCASLCSAAYLRCTDTCTK